MKFFFTPLVILFSLNCTLAFEGRPTSTALPQKGRSAGDTELAAILTKWNKKTEEQKSFTCEVNVFSYDMTFETEERSSGKLTYHSSKEQHLDLHSLKFKEGELSKNGPLGKPMLLRSSPHKISISWIENLHICVDHLEKIYLKFSTTDTGIFPCKLFNLSHSPYFSSQKSLQCYEISILRDQKKGGMHDPKNGVIHLLFVSKPYTIAPVPGHLHFLLDSKTYRIKAVKKGSSFLNHHTVFSFHNYKKRRNLPKTKKHSEIELRKQGYKKVTFTE